jgi:hypothetical protein
MQHITHIVHDLHDHWSHLFPFFTFHNIENRTEVHNAYFFCSSYLHYTVKKRLVIFWSLAGMSLTKLSLAGDIPAGDGKIANLFLQSSLHSEPTFRRSYTQSKLYLHSHACADDKQPFQQSPPPPPIQPVAVS